MTGAEGSLREIRAALAGIARRLEDLAGGAEAEPPRVPGAPLDEVARAGLARLQGILAIEPGLGRDAALLLATDRVLHQAGADCVAVFVVGTGGRLEAVATAGLPLAPPDPDHPGGIVARAFREREPMRSGREGSPPDGPHAGPGLGHALATPIAGGMAAPVGVLFAARRRASPFEGAALELLMLVADRLGPVLSDRAPAEDPPASVGLTADLDLDRVSAAVVRAAAGRLGAPAVALLLPELTGLTLAAGEGLPSTVGLLDAGTGALAAVLASRTPWQPEAGVTDEGLAGLLGVPPQLVVPLVVGDELVAVLAAGGPGPVAARHLGPMLPEAAVAIRNARLYRDALDGLAEARPPRPIPAAPQPAQDFANLLAVVLGRLAVVRDRVGDPGLTRELDVAEEAAWRAAEAVRGLLGFAPGQREGSLAPLDVSRVVRQTVAEIERRWAGREPRPPAVRVELEAVPPVRGSADDLREAVEHLLDNAIESGHDEGPVTVRARWDGGARVEVIVEDRGAGMDEATRRRAVDPFFSTKGPGRLGLGLPVTQAIVSRHHGVLEIVSAPGLGTTVRLVLPTAASERRLATGTGVAPVRVLVVEDEVPVRDALVGALTQQGHLAHVAPDGRAALTLLECEPIDAVVTDLALPDMSGLEIARAVKRLRPGTPVILISAWPGGPDPASVEASGVDAVIEKPVGLSEFRATLAVTLARRRATRA